MTNSMQRRSFSKTSLGALSALGVSAILPSLALAQAKKFEEETDFRVLEKRAVIDTPADKVEVLEFFWYSCPHCNAFEPKLEPWIKSLPKDVNFKRVPIAFRDSFVPQQRLYYALEAMGKVEQMQSKVFVAIHGEKQNLDNQDSIATWVQKQGLDKAKFLEHYNSFAVATKTRKATQLQNEYKIDGVPSLGVAGRYYVDGTIAKSMERALTVVDYLIGEARRLK